MLSYEIFQYALGVIPHLIFPPALEKTRVLIDYVGKLNSEALCTAVHFYGFPLAAVFFAVNPYD